eukprot:gene12985-17412_t
MMEGDSFLHPQQFLGSQFPQQIDQEKKLNFQISKLFSLFKLSSKTLSMSYNENESKTAGHNGLDSSTGVDSVHLKLSEIKVNVQNNSSIASNRNKLNNIDETKRNATIPKLQTIHEFYSVTDGTSVIGCEGNLTKLEYFGVHVFGRNLSLDASLQYRKLTLSVDNSSTVIQNNIKSLWKRGLFMTNSKHFFDKLSPLTPFAEKFERTMQSHVARIKALTIDSNSLDGIVEFLKEQNIGSPYDNQLHPVFHHTNRTIEETLAIIKNFSIWFRQEFPYYYDKCSLCDNSNNNEFLGVIFPSLDEQSYLASRTELYLCGSCSNISRFPRYNNVTKVLSTRKGRCGEYSVLMMQFLEKLGYQSRWVVDWEDHVWTEILLDGRWIHIDPCEAAVNEPFIYEGWGKNQTYIFAFSEKEIEDVTCKYTTNYNASLERRIADGMNETIIHNTVQKVLQDLYN